MIIYLAVRNIFHISEQKKLSLHPFRELQRLRNKSVWTPVGCVQWTLALSYRLGIISVIWLLHKFRMWYSCYSHFTDEEMGLERLAKLFRTNGLEEEEPELKCCPRILSPLSRWPTPLSNTWKLTEDREGSSTLCPELLLSVRHLHRHSFNLCNNWGDWFYYYFYSFFFLSST